MTPMKTTFALLMLAVVQLSPLVSSAEEPRPASIGSALLAPSSAAPKLRSTAPLCVSIGGAELKLEVATTRLGIIMSFAL
jgi:hypothetical protein